MRGIVTCASTSSSLAGNWTRPEPGDPSDTEHSRVGFTGYLFHRLDGTSEMQAASASRTDAEKLDVHSHHVPVHLPTSGTLVPDESSLSHFLNPDTELPSFTCLWCLPITLELAGFSGNLLSSLLLPKAVQVNAGNSSSPSPSCSH